MAEAVRASYLIGQNDEQLEPLVLVDSASKPIGRFQDGDYVIFYDIRGEREIELTRSLTEKNFDKFQTARMKINFITMIEYDKKLDVQVAFPSLENIKDTLCAVISASGLSQVKIAESEKAVHVTYFLNGKTNTVFKGEERVIIQSFRYHRTPAEMPEMKIKELTEIIRAQLETEKNNVIIANFANIDVVGHTEDIRAIKEAVEAVDTALGVVLSFLRRECVTAIITSDHGTVERFYYPDGTIDTGHTISPVPLVLFEPDMERLENIELRKVGELSDIAPTVLDILNLRIPALMTGRSLLVKNPYFEDGKKRILILILDGWGLSDKADGNLILSSSTPVMDYLMASYPFTKLAAAGEAVGLPPGSVGNSEVGHLHIGAGRRIESDRVRIDRAIADGSFYVNEVIRGAIRKSISDGKALHLLGILSFYSSHGSLEHLKALLKMAKTEGAKKVFIHAIVGRRGEREGSGAHYIEELERFTQELQLGTLVSVIGRFWALDREENWDRVEKTYRLLVHGEGKHVIEKN